MKWLNWKTRFYSVVVLLVAAGIVMVWLGDQGIRTLRLERQSQTQLIQMEMLREQVERQLQHATTAGQHLSHNPAVLDYFRRPDPAAVQRMSLAVETVVPFAGQSTVYVMDRRGDVVSVAGHDAALFVGKNYDFRPYFRHAMHGEAVIYPALGVSTGVRGFYVGTPVRLSAEGPVVGVVVVKLLLHSVDRILTRFAGPTVLVSPDGVVFASNHSAWLYHTLGPMPEQRRQSLLVARQFADQPLTSLPLDLQQDEVVLDGRRCKVYYLSLQLQGWSLRSCMPLDGSFALSDRQQLLVVIGLTVFVVVVAVIILLMVNIYFRHAAVVNLGLTQYAVDQADDAVFWADVAGYFFYVNDSASRLTGYRRDALLGKHIMDLDASITPSNWDAYLSELQREKAICRAIKLRQSSGQLVDVEFQAIWLNYHGRQYQFVYCRDITERCQAEVNREMLLKEMEQKNAELERFVYTVSHDLKGPLTTIKGFLGYIHRSLDAGDTRAVESDLKRIGRAAEKMELLLRDLLELSRVGRLVNDPEEVAFEDLAREAVELLDGPIHDYHVTVDIEPDLGLVRVDRLRIVEVLQNLIENAIKFMGEQPLPRVRIGMELVDNQRRYFVSDNGIGIDSAYQSKIFDLFDKLDPGAEGTGIGLALVRRIIEVHGGEVWVESQGKGRGATFYFTLPGSGAGAELS